METVESIYQQWFPLPSYPLEDLMQFSINSGVTDGELEELQTLQNLCDTPEKQERLSFLSDIRKNYNNPLNTILWWLWWYIMRETDGTKYGAREANKRHFAWRIHTLQTTTSRHEKKTILQTLSGYEKGLHPKFLPVARPLICQIRNICSHSSSSTTGSEVMVVLDLSTTSNFLEKLFILLDMHTWRDFTSLLEKQ